MYSAIFSRTYPMKEIAEVLDAVTADGFAGIQANLSSAGLASLPEILPLGTGEEIGSAAQARGIRIAALSGTYNMAHPDARVRQEFRVGFRNVVQAAQRMGAPVVTLCTGSRDPSDMWKFHPENSSEAAWIDLRAELEFALAIAEHADIRLAIEPEPTNIIRDGKTAERLLKEMASEHLGIILDAANLLTPETLSKQHEVMAEAADLLGSALLLAHAKDIDASGKVVAPGEGSVDLVAFARILRATGYEGALVAHGFASDKTAIAAKALQQILGESV